MILVIKTCVLIFLFNIVIPRPLQYITRFLVPRDAKRSSPKQYYAGVHFRHNILTLISRKGRCYNIQNQREQWYGRMHNCAASAERLQERNIVIQFNHRHSCVPELFRYRFLLKQHVAHIAENTYFCNSYEVL